MRSRYLSMAARVLAVLALGSCGDLEDIDFDAPTASTTLAVTSTNGVVSNGTVGNGLAFNGLPLNGLALNGLPLNGLALNGLALNGLALNGLPLNGLFLNGLALNGLPLNGLALNGLPLNGLPLNGLALNGLPLNGLALNGLPLNGLPLNGLALNGLPLNGLALNGLPLNGLPLNGLPLNGLPLNGLALNGLPLNGLPLNGLALNGLPLNGLALNGLPLNGLPLNGLPLNGLALNGLALNGLTLDGAQQTNFKTMLTYLVRCALPSGQSVTVTDFNGSTQLAYNGLQGIDPGWRTSAALSSASQTMYTCVATEGGGAVSSSFVTQGYFRSLLTHLVACALTVGDSVTVTDFNGSNAVYAGSQGIDPGWKNGPPDSTKQSAMASCVQSRAAAAGHYTASFPLTDTFKQLLSKVVECALPAGDSVTVTDFNGSTQVVFPGAVGLDPAWKTGQPTLGQSVVMYQCVRDRSFAAGLGVAHFPVTVDNFKKLLGYLASCALASTDSVAVMDINGTTQLNFPGMLGLAPSWKTGSLDVTGQKYVSACLAARTNANGQPVRISLRGPPAPVSSATEVEKAVYTFTEGGFWGNVFSATPELHTCQGDGPGISGRVCTQAGGCGFQPHGTCATICSSKDASNGFVSNCNGGAGSEAAVLTTFLPLGTMADVGMDHQCVVDTIGVVRCFGHGSAGQLGHGGEMYETNAVQALLPSPAAQIALTEEASCARQKNGEVWCWGSGRYGELGTTPPYYCNNSGGACAVTPIRLTALGSDVTSIRSSRSLYAGVTRATYAIKSNGTLWGWGQSPFGFGNGSTLTYGGPVEITALSNEVALVRVANHSCALKNDGTLWCWGKNEFGQLGSGACGVNNTSAVRVGATQLANGVTDVVVGDDHTCVRTTSGAVWCTGSNTYSQVSSTAVPTACSEFGSPRQCLCQFTQHLAIGTDTVRGSLVAGNYFNCVTKTNGSISCWGSGIGTPQQISAATGRVIELHASGPYLFANYLPNGVGKSELRVQAGYYLMDHTRNFDLLSPYIDLTPTCGVGSPPACDVGENKDNCPMDCTAAVCGDGVCQVAGGETMSSCASDCRCGNLFCDTAFNESKYNCPADCACGNGVCNTEVNENYSNCPSDCNCGNSVCEPAYNETFASCSADCPCVPVASCAELDPVCGAVSNCNGSLVCAACTTLTEAEPGNNTPSGATTVATGKTYGSHRIGAANDVDWFKIAVAKTRTLVIKMRPPYDKNFNVEIYNTAGTTKLASPVYGGVGAAESVQYKNTTTATVTYTIKVMGASASNYSTSPYYLKVTVQ